ncbi:hypothetical protein V5799_023697 [Amblyomma americanum]|uniref:Secreted protein n=1 Tax=Amblyomma americanum TaxID=6943 RepID=A0AAQ4FGT0_AMBAM
MQTLLHQFYFVTLLLVLAYPWCAVMGQVPLEHSTPVYADENHDLPSAACGLPLLVSRPATLGTPPVLCHYKTTALSTPASSSPINCLFSSVRVSGHLRAARIQTLLHLFLFVTLLLVLAYPWCALFAQVPLELSTPVYADEDHDLPPAACGLPVLVLLPATAGTPTLLCHYKTAALSAPASSSPINYLFSIARVSGHRRAARIQTLLHPFLFVTLLLVLAYPWCAIFAQVPFELSTPVYADEDHDLPPAACRLPVLVSQPATVGTPPVLCHHKITALSAPASSSSINCLFSSVRYSGHRRAVRIQTLLHPFFFVSQLLVLAYLCVRVSGHLRAARIQTLLHPILFVTQLLVLAYPWCALFAQVPLELSTPVYADEDHDLPPAACGLPVLVLLPAAAGTPTLLCHYKTAAFSAPVSSSPINYLFSIARISGHRRAVRIQTLLHLFLFVSQLLVLAYLWCAVFALVPLELSMLVYADEDHDLPPAACALPLLVSRPATVGTPLVLCHYKTTALSTPASSSPINCLFSSVRVSGHLRAARIQTLLHPILFVTQLLVLAYPCSLRVASSGFATCPCLNTTGALSLQDNSIFSASIIITYKLPFSSVRVSGHLRAAKIQTLLHPFLSVSQLLVLAYPWCAVFALVPLELSTPVYADEDHDLPPAACALPLLVSRPATVGTPLVLCHYKTTALSAPASSSAIKCLFSSACVSWHRRAAKMQTLLHPSFFVTLLLVLAYPWCAVLAQVPLELWTPVYADEDHDLPPAACGLPVLVSQPATVGTPPVLCRYKTTALAAPESSYIDIACSQVRASLLVLAYPWCVVLGQVPLEHSTPVYADENHDLLPAACGLPLLVSRPATVGTPPVLCHYKTTALSTPASSSPINCLFSSVRVSGQLRAARIQTLLHPFLFVTQLLVLAYPWCAVFAQVPLELSTSVYADEDHDLPPEACGLHVLVLLPATAGTPSVLCHYKTTALSAAASS